MNLSRHRIRYHINGVLSVTALWIISALLFVYIKFSDIPNSMLSKVYGFEPWISKNVLYQMALIISALVGMVMGATHTFLYPLIIRTRNIIINFCLKFLIFILLSVSVCDVFFLVSGLPSLDFSHAKPGLFAPALLDVFIYLIFIEIVVGILVTIRTNLGRNYLKKLIRSTYFSPKEEYRVFMFTDLKHSTSSAERLGSIDFSRFIQDCFKEFSNAALDFGGEIYQFVGDEVVTSWLAEKKFDYRDCVALHFSLCNRLERKKDYFRKEYGLFPEFRSSIHVGNVSAALVGEFKTEIAYHGGVLNLCSRLQEICRLTGRDLVVSQTFHHMLIKAPADYCFEEIEDIVLKGIAEKQSAYSVSINQA